MVCGVIWQLIFTLATHLKFVNEDICLVLSQRLSHSRTLSLQDDYALNMEDAVIFPFVCEGLDRSITYLCVQAVYVILNNLPSEYCQAHLETPLQMGVK